ncbi:MAG: Alanine racemase 1 [Candidatus Omnitrophica bacterium]|nr:Alanine racemase 1 [Candidatus Omnitrophota bacterium]
MIGPSVWIEVDLASLARNVRAFRRGLRHAGSAIMAIIKDDAYGLGMPAVARRLWREGVRAYGVASAQEALALRGVLPRATILVLGCVHPSALPGLVRARVRLTLSSPEDVRQAARAARHGRAIAHLKIDTGMGRLGVWHEDCDALFAAVRAAAGRIEVEGIYTHLSHADAADERPTTVQLWRYRRALARAACWGLKPKLLHAANSAGSLRFAALRLDVVRPGLVLHGIDPMGRGLSREYRPVATWKTRVASIKSVGPGRTLSYGGTHRVRRATRIAALPVGYSHGYRVAWSNKASVLIGGRRCPVVGRVTMDQILVDVGHLKAVRRWQEVVLLGRQGRERIGAEELARWAGTIPYEVQCGLSARIPRIYKNIR